MRVKIFLRASLILGGVATLAVGIGSMVNQVLSAQPISEVEWREGKMRFPNVSGRNIEGQLYNLPGDFESPYNVVLIAYTQEQQFTVNTWLDFLAEVRQAYPQVRSYELPTLMQYSRVQQAWIDYWMDNGISEPYARATTITLYLDLAAFNKALAIPSMADVQVLVVDREGQVYWRTIGRYTREKATELLAVIQTLPQTAS